MAHSITDKARPRKNGRERVKRHVLEEFAAGQRIPNEDELSRQLGTSRYAATRALMDLNAEGLVERKPRSGTFRARQGGQDDIGRHVEKRMVAFMADEYESFMTGELMRGIEARCRLKQLGVSLLNSDYSPEIEEAHLKTLRPQNYAGAIVRIGEHRENIRILNRLVEQDYPLVLVDRRDEDSRFPCVKMRQKEAVQAGVRHLIELGHRRIAYVGYDKRVQVPYRELRLREEGYRTAMQHDNLPVRPEYIQGGSLFELGERPTRSYFDSVGYEPMNRLLLQDEPPTAVFMMSYFFAIGAFRAIQDHGLKVPDDISLMCIDDEPRARCGHVPLTVIAQPLRQMGSKAVDVLEDLLAHKHDVQRDHWLEGRLVVRDSTAPPPQ